MADNVGPFDSSKDWIAHARADIELLREAIKKTATGAKFEPTAYIEKGADDERIWAIRAIIPSPELLKTRVASILNALRSALDQATYAASVELGAKEEALDRLYFPFEGTKQAFENAFKENGRAKYIPKELHPFLEKLSVYPEDKAYEGGNTLLYAISKITNPNKHKTTHRVSLKFFGKML